jgi:hypothetical protein
MEHGDNLQDLMGETLAAGMRRLPRAGDLRGSGLSKTLPIGVLGHGSSALLGGLQAHPATSPSPAPAAGPSSFSAAGSSQAVPLASMPVGRALGVARTSSASRSSRPVRFTGQIESTPALRASCDTPTRAQLPVMLTPWKESS